MSDNERPDGNQNQAKFSIRTLLAITTWAALCYAAIFTSQNLLAFQIVRFIGISAIVISAVLPLFLKLENQKFWNAYSIAILSHFCFSFMQVYSNPYLAHASEFVCKVMAVDGPSLTDFQWVDYQKGHIGRFSAIYYCTEIHFVVLMGLLAGVLWQNLKNQTPFWIVGVWAFFIVMDISGDLGLYLDFLTSIAIFSILPACLNFEGALRPFWTTFGVFASLVGVQAITSQSFGFTLYMNDLVATYWPNSSSLLADSVTFISVPITAAIAGSIVQIIVRKYELAALKEDD